MSQPTLFVSTLRKHHRERLERTAKKTRNPKFRDRCLAILWSSDRVACSEIAQRLRVNPTTAMRWINDYISLGFDGIRIGKSPGRTRKLDADAEAVLQDALGCHPRDRGYAQATWTATLLRDHVYQEVHIYVHPETIRCALRRMNYRHKRPKLSLKNKQDSKEVQRARRQRNAALKKRPPIPIVTSSYIKTSASSTSIPA